MEYLVGTAKDIELAWPQSLWHASCIDGGTNYVQKPLKKQPIEPNLICHLLRAVQPQPVDDWKDGRQAHRDKHPGSKRAPFWGPESRRKTHKNASKAYCANHGPVDELQTGRTIEAVVNTGDETAGNQTDDSHVIQGVANTSHGRRMI